MINLYSWKKIRDGWGWGVLRSQCSFEESVFIQFEFIKGKYFNYDFHQEVL